jgi:hypothetical protein
MKQTPTFWKIQDSAVSVRFQQFPENDGREQTPCSAGPLTSVHLVRNATFSAYAVVLVSYYYIFQSVLSLRQLTKD